MVQQAKSNLSAYGNVQVIQSHGDRESSDEGRREGFSNAALYWVLDQEGVSSHLSQQMKPDGELSFLLEFLEIMSGRWFYRFLSVTMIFLYILLQFNNRNSYYLV